MQTFQATPDKVAAAVKANDIVEKGAQWMTAQGRHVLSDQDDMKAVALNLNFIRLSATAFISSWSDRTWRPCAVIHCAPFSTMSFAFTAAATLSGVAWKVCMWPTATPSGDQCCANFLHGIPFLCGFDTPS